MKQIKLPIELRNDMIDFISHVTTFSNRLFGTRIEISDSFTDTKIIRVFEEISYLVKAWQFDLEEKAYRDLQNELADFMLLEELNKGIKDGKKNSSD